MTSMSTYDALLDYVFNERDMIAFIIRLSPLTSVVWRLG